MIALNRADTDKAASVSQTAKHFAFHRLPGVRSAAATHSMKTFLAGPFFGPRGRSIEHVSLELASMFACPHCHSSTISHWRKINATRSFPARCAQCHGLSFISGWAHSATALVAELLLWGTLVAAFLALSWLPLLMLPLELWAWSLIVGAVFKLLPVDGAVVRKARRNIAIQVGVIAALGSLAAMFSGNTF
jgi:hypothetical protein